MYILFSDHSKISHEVEKYLNIKILVIKAAPLLVNINSQLKFDKKNSFVLRYKT
jgi:hypothetical protein